MTFFQASAVALTMSIAGIGVCAPVFAQTEISSVASESQAQSGVLVKKSKKLKGSWEIVQRGERTFIVFGDDFRAAKGPDLKVFLSPETITNVSGETAIVGSVNLGELQATKGAQEYEIPEGVDLSAFNSVLVHCEAYAVLWGGSSL